VFGVLKKHQPTIFYGVPTLYAALLADPARPKKSN
jgi:benzoate-CoA ligase